MVARGSGEAPKPAKSHPKTVKKPRRHFSSKTGARIAGPSPERLEEIAEEILINLPPRKGISRADLTNAVSKTMKELRGRVVWQIKLHARRTMQDRAADLFQAVMEVERLLDTAPGMMHALLFSDLKLSHGELPSEQEMKDGYIKRSEAFFNELHRLHMVCGHFMGKRIGSHGNSDHAKSLSAWSAYGLMQNHSAAKITGTQDGPFRTVTSLLYEALSGYGDVDLKRACDAVLKANRVRPRQRKRVARQAEAVVNRRPG
jgi:hypothetical protein